MERNETERLWELLCAQHTKSARKSAARTEKTSGRALVSPRLYQGVRVIKC